MSFDPRNAEEWADKIAEDITNNRHSYQKHCALGRELMQMDGTPATREQYQDLIKRTLLDPRAQARCTGIDKSSLAIYSHETRMVVVVNPRMTGDASTAFPLTEKPPLKVLPEITDMLEYAASKKSIHNDLIYNHGDGFPRNARETFQSKFEVRDMNGRYTGRNRAGEPVKPMTGPEGPFAEWLKIRAVPQKLSQYFGLYALGAATTTRHARPAYGRAPHH